MELIEKVIETTETIKAQQQLVLDQPLPFNGPAKVRLLVFVPEEVDLKEKEWLKAASVNPAFDFLKAPEEDIYTLSNGRPFNDQR